MIAAMPTEVVGRSLVALRPPARTTVLTYDDGPTPGTTDLLLPVLAEAHATATFFVLGWVAERYGPRWTLVGGGALTMLGTLLATAVFARSQSLMIWRTAEEPSEVRLRPALSPLGRATQTAVAGRAHANTIAGASARFAVGRRHG